MQESSENLPIKSTLSALKIGESAQFPAVQYSSVNVTACTYGFESGRKFKVAKNRESKKVLVTRLE